MVSIAALCIYIVTWNVGTHSPRNVDLSMLLSLNGTSSCPNGYPDIYVVGMQEVSANAGKQVIGLFKDDPWVFKIAHYLEDLEFVKVDSEQLQGILITMFAQRQHIPHMKDIESSETRTGLGGLWGNKGAVSIRMSLYGTGVTFICAHLAAHDHKLKQRIADYNQIVDYHKYSVPRYNSIFDHDFVFWFGDLNFRLSDDDSAWDIRTEVENGNIGALLKKDQLLLLRETGNAFSLMQEQLPKFAPTFKFNEGSNDYNLKRRPAWCDRILSYVQENKYPDIKLNLKQLSYRSFMEYNISDHKPVTAEFLYKVDTTTGTVDELYEKTHGGSEKHKFLRKTLWGIKRTILRYLICVSDFLIV